MDVFFNNTQRPVLPQVMEALQRLRDSPQQLAHERDRYLEPPPPYSESESGETTQPATPGSPVVDECYRQYKRKAARAKSKPLPQFRSQAKRERERLEHQISTERFGRRQTLPWDDSLDLQANSENNVRSLWVEQGIWGDEWGPAWPKDSHPMTTKWTHRGGGPFFGPHNPTTSKSMPGARWGHEDTEPEPEADPDSDPESEPEPEPELEREQEEQEEQEEQPIFGIDATRRSKKKPKSPKPRRPVRYTQTPMGPIAQYAAPRPTVRNPEASRPYDQFLYQISKERDWLRDENNYKTPGRNIDLDARAYEGVKNNWITDGIWNREWSDLPGKTWAHEEPEEEESVGGLTAPNGAAGGQHAHSPRHPTLSGTTLIPEFHNGRADGGSAQASRHDENSTTTTEPGPFGRPRETSNRQIPFTFGSHNVERGHRQSLGNARPSQAETGSGQRSSSPSVPAQAQIHPSVRSAVRSAVISGEGRTKQGGARPAPVNRNRRADPDAEASNSQSLDLTGDLPPEHNVPSPPRRSKRKRNSDAVEDTQPPKRPRRDTRNRNQGDDVDEQTSNNHAVETNGDLISPERSTPPPPRRSKRDRKPDAMKDRQPPKRARRNTRRSVPTAHDASNAADSTPLRRSARNASKGKETVGPK